MSPAKLGRPSEPAPTVSPSFAVPAGEPASSALSAGRPPAIELQGLTHRYPGAERDALAGVTLEVEAGEAFAVLGPNGGGKSTTFRILATLLQPRLPAAVARVFGHDLARDPAAARRAMGVVFQSPSVDIKLSARENLACQARLYGLTRRASAPRIDDALNQFGLSDRAGDRVETFSGGMRRRLEIAKALLHGPRLLLMDEPATGLDPAARRELWDHLGALREQRDISIVWTTHLMDEAERADRLAVMADGRVVAVARPAELMAEQGGHVVTVVPGSALAPDTVRVRIERELGPWAAGRGPVVAEDGVRFEHGDGPSVVARVAAWWPGDLERVSVGRPTLEDAYLRLTAAAPDRHE
ncbi:MAG: ABC transporter ATP-binding protein [Planctomycetota bacterium]